MKESSRLLPRSRRSRSADFEVRADARQKLARGRALDDEVVGPGGERLDLVLLSVVRREDDDGQTPRRGLRAQQTAEREAADAGQLDVEDDEVAALLVQLAQRLGRVAAGQNPVPL